MKTSNFHFYINRITRACLVCTMCITTMALLTSGTAQAEPKSTIWGWGYSHWKNQDFQPYLHDAHTPHNELLNRDWKPSDWLDQFEKDQALIDRFYKADIVRKQYIEDKVAYLVVGPNFYALGTEEQQRIAATVDTVYGITDRKLHGSYQLVDWKTDAVIGQYSQYGLTLQ